MKTMYNTKPQHLFPGNKGTAHMPVVRDYYSRASLLGRHYQRWTRESLKCPSLLFPPSSLDPPPMLPQRADPRAPSSYPARGRAVPALTPAGRARPLREAACTTALSAWRKDPPGPAPPHCGDTKGPEEGSGGGRAGGHPPGS
jgi:hypothetical protein